MTHKFEYYKCRTSGEITIFGVIFGVITAYKIGEDKRVYLTSESGTDPALCAIYSLDEAELHEMHESKEVFNEFISELDLSFECNFKSLLRARVKILENEEGAQKYYEAIRKKIPPEPAAKVLGRLSKTKPFHHKVEAILNEIYNNMTPGKHD